MYSQILEESYNCSVILWPDLAKPPYREVQMQSLNGSVLTLRLARGQLMQLCLLLLYGKGARIRQQGVDQAAQRPQSGRPAGRVSPHIPHQPAPFQEQPPLWNCCTAKDNNRCFSPSERRA